MQPVARILDANANRAREALRVMQDYARFVLDDEPLTRELKEMRHALRDILGAWPAGVLEATRDTAGDVGTRVATEQEYQRTSLSDVIIAAGKRLSEALRTLEEFAKVSGPFTMLHVADAGATTVGQAHLRAGADPSPSAIAGRLEALRYRGYIVEQQLQSRMAAASGIDRWSPGVAGLWIDARRPCPTAEWGAIQSRMSRLAQIDRAAEVSTSEHPGHSPEAPPRRGGMLFRFNMTRHDATELGSASAVSAPPPVAAESWAEGLLAMARWCRGRGIAVVAAGRLEDALLLGADGLLLCPSSRQAKPDSSGLGEPPTWPIAVMRRVVGRTIWIGREVTGTADVAAAWAEGADWVALDLAAIGAGVGDVVVASRRAGLPILALAPAVGTGAMAGPGGGASSAAAPLASLPLLVPAAADPNNDDA